MHSDSEVEIEDSRPATPVDDDCCHNACDPCIFDIHRKLLEEYRRTKKRSIKEKRRKNVLSPLAYKSFNVVSIAEIVNNYILVTLKQEEREAEEDAAVLIEPGQYVMMKAWGLTRPFTPISWSKKRMTFLVKLYGNGKFSSCLQNASIGDKINMRGPYGDFNYKRNSYHMVLMFSMGSGIAAHYPIAKAITADDLEETRIHLVGGFKKLTEIPLRNEIQNLADYWNFKCTIHVSQSSDEIINYHGININHGRLNEVSTSKILQTSSAHTTLILICGTEEFNRSVKQWVTESGYENIHIFH